MVRVLGGFRDKFVLELLLIIILRKLMWGLYVSLEYTAYGPGWIERYLGALAHGPPERAGFKPPPPMGLQLIVFSYGFECPFSCAIYFIPPLRWLLGFDHIEPLPSVRENLRRTTNKVNQVAFIIICKRT
jgi:hypothetical protein